MNAKSGREALKCALPPKTLWKQGIPLNKVWLKVASPSMRPFARATSSHMGERSKSPATPHAKRRWSSEISATLPEDALGEGGGRSAPNLVATTP